MVYLPLHPIDTFALILVANLEAVAKLLNCSSVLDIKWNLWHWILRIRMVLESNRIAQLLMASVRCVLELIFLQNSGHTLSIISFGCIMLHLMALANLLLIKFVLVASPISVHCKSLVVAYLYFPVDLGDLINSFQMLTLGYFLVTPIPPKISYI